MSLKIEDNLSIKGKAVLMILYNYSDYDYSILKIMEKLEDAVNFIRERETDYKNNLKIIEVSHPIDIKNKICVNDTLNICFITSGKYHKFNLCEERENGLVSCYAIVPMIIN